LGGYNPSSAQGSKTKWKVRGEKTNEESCDFYNAGYSVRGSRAGARPSNGLEGFLALAYRRGAGKPTLTYKSLHYNDGNFTARKGALRNSIDFGKPCQIRDGFPGRDRGR
jgi:hypothetical protein